MNFMVLAENAQVAGSLGSGYWKTERLEDDFWALDLVLRGTTWEVLINIQRGKETEMLYSC